MNRKHSQRGAAALEFGLCFLAFFFIMYGIMEFGRIVASYNILAGATREATRYASVHGSSSGSLASKDDITALVKKWSVGLDTSLVSVDTTWSPGTGPGSTVLIKATYTAKPFTSLITGDISLQSSSKMIVSQ